MFQNLSKRLNDIFDKLKARGALSEADVTAALREVRVALLEADVALPVVKAFVEHVKEKAIGQEVFESVTPGQMVIKIVHDQLVEFLGSENEAINLNVTPPAVIMMVGLQGSGKTTTTAKIAKRFQEKENKKVLMASLDIYRPAAQRQLEVLGQDNAIATVPIIEKQSPSEITKRALKMGREEGFDIILLDTAGRLHIDEDLMEELEVIKKIASPSEILLVADAMTGQDAVTVAKAFHEKLAVTGIALTRIDGDARGGAALSMKYVTGCPIKVTGIGEQIDKIDLFHPERIASRILDMGDVVSLVERAAEAIDQKEAEKLAKRMQAGHFDLNDLANQLKQINKMGGMGSILKMFPGVGKIEDKLEKAGFDETIIKRQLAMIGSMTRKERRYPKLLNASRKIRIASGSGVQVSDINQLLKQFKGMEKMMKRMKKLGQKGLLRQGLAGLFQ